MSPEQLLTAGATAAAKWPELTTRDIEEITKAIGPDARTLWESEPGTGTEQAA